MLVWLYGGLSVEDGLLLTAQISGWKSTPMKSFTSRQVLNFYHQWRPNNILREDYEAKHYPIAHIL